MKLLAILVTWAGCLLPYLASPRQQLTRATLSRPLAWAGFCGALVLATLLFNTSYNALSAGLLVLTCVMCVWPALVLAAPHLRHRPMLLNGLGILTLALVVAVS